MKESTTYTQGPFRQLDLASRINQARFSSSLSPEAAMLAWMDWLSHLATSPGKKLELLMAGMQNWGRFFNYLQECMTTPLGETRDCVDRPVSDRRFAAPEWQYWPFNALHQGFLLGQEWLAQATTQVWGVEKKHEDFVSFYARQWLDMFSPGNQLLTNPVVLRRTLEERGANLLRGVSNWQDDVRRLVAEESPEGAENFVPGQSVARTPGKVVFRNRLIELIQYSPTTDKVKAEPILIVPAWIMKYYILDLSEHNSMVKYLVDQGHTVFCISWKNPDEGDRHLGMDDYLDLGLGAAIDAVTAIVPKARVHATGYCLGGTLLAIAAARMARDGDDRLASLTFFAAQTDFSEPGELALFINESQISLLEAQMQQKGYLAAEQMAGAFQMLRSYDLLWSKMVNEYLLGERRPLNDLMAWNADATRMPAHMHAQYLRRLFLNNELSRGVYTVGDKPVFVSDIKVPMFAVGTVSDHVAPWRSVYKLNGLADTSEVTFLLTSGGHNAGIVSEPGRPRRSYQVHTQTHGSKALDPDTWQAQTPVTEGSWWPEWQRWLAARSGAEVAPPTMGAPRKGYDIVCDAPGEYVLQK